MIRVLNLEGLFKVKDSYNIDAVATLVGAAMREDYNNACTEKIKVSRAKLTVDLKELGFTVRASYGNFVLATPLISRAEYS